MFNTKVVCVYNTHDFGTLAVNIEECFTLIQ